MARNSLRDSLNTIIFGTSTPAGRAFDMALIYTILVSVVAVMLDSVDSIHFQYGKWLFIAEWVFTILFTVEYLIRIYVSPRPLSYVFSFYGIVDLLSFIPSYLALLITGAQYLLIIRLVRVLRVFRVLKLVRYMHEANILLRTLFLARRKIFVFFSAVLVLCIVFGSLMFVVEGPEHGFTSIPKSIYWTIVTITTVGYGDITPQTALGQVISTMAMLIGYSIIAIPTGIVSAQLFNELARVRAENQCEHCGRGNHEEDAEYCKYCGTKFSAA